MSKRNRREHGRILSVETKNRGDSLADDFAAGVTSITVNDAGDFDEDGGWLYIGAQTVEYLECDDDTGVITLADPLAAAAEQGDPVSLWSDLYGEVVDYQLALVELDGEYDNPDPVAAEVAEGVGELPEGDRGRAGESCTLHRVAEDEWEVVAVGGRSAKSKGLRAEADDFYVLTAADITAGSATIPLSHRPVDEWLIAVLAGVPQRPTNYSIDYDAQKITWPLDGWEQAGMEIWVHYAYRKGVRTAVASPTLDGLPLVGWFSSDYEIAHQSAGAVTTWTNLAGSYSMSGTATLQATAGPNGGPAMHFSGSERLVLNRNFFGDMGDPAEGWFVRKRDSDAPASNHNFGSYSLGDIYYPNSGGTVHDDFWSDLLLKFTPTMSLTSWRRYSAWSASNDRGVMLDEVVQAASTAASTPWGPSGSIEVGFTGGHAHDGSYACILLFDAVLTAEQRAQVVGYLEAYPSGGLPT